MRYQYILLVGFLQIATLGGLLSQDSPTSLEVVGGQIDKFKGSNETQENQKAIIQPPFVYEQQAKSYMKTGVYDSVIWASVIALSLRPESKRSVTYLEESFISLVQKSKVELSDIEDSTISFIGDETIGDLQDGVNICDRDTTIMGSILTKLPTTLRDTIQSKLIQHDIADYDQLRHEFERRWPLMVDSAADMHYLHACQLMTYRDDIDSNRLAVLELEKTMSYVSGHKDTGIRYSQASEAGTKQIGVLPFMHQGLQVSNEVAHDMTDQVFSQFVNAEIFFVEYLPPNDVLEVLQENNLPQTLMESDHGRERLQQELGLDEVWRGRIMEAQPGNIQKTTQRLEGSITVLDTTGYKIPEGADPADKNVKKVPITQEREVNFYYNLYTESVESRISVTFQVIDLTGKNQSTGWIDRNYSHVFKRQEIRSNPYSTSRTKDGKACAKAVQRIRIGLNESPIPAPLSRLRLLNRQAAHFTASILVSRESLDKLHIISRRDQLRSQQE